MALSDMQITIADEISRSDLSTQITREIGNSITFYSAKKFFFTENSMTTLTTISGQREYSLPANFVSVLSVRSQMATGGMIYPIDPSTIQHIETLDQIQTYTSNYILLYALFNGLIRLYPPPIGGLPVYIRGTVLLPTLTTTAATKAYAKNTAYTAADTVVDPNGNIQTAQTSGTTASAPTNTYTANTAYSVGNTVLDGNQNLQTCSTAGTSGYILANDRTQWGRIVNSVTTDGTAQWTLTSTQWSTDFGSITVDGSVVWKLTTALSNAWMTSAEELIRTRTIRQLYARYIRDQDMAAEYALMEKENVKNLYEKNVGQTALNRVTPHL